MVHTWYGYGISIFAKILNCSTYDMYKTKDGILHTFTTNNYSMREMSTQIIVPGHVQHSLPILSEYYWAGGMYDSSSSSSDVSSSSDELPSLYNPSSNSVPSTSLETSTSSIDIQHYLVDSTCEIEGAEFLEFLILSSSSSTSESSSPQFRYTYCDLLDYSPADVNQPQPTEDIYVPRETINNPQLQNSTCGIPPMVSKVRLAKFEKLLFGPFPSTYCWWRGRCYHL